MPTQKSIDLVLLSTSSPLICGIYEDLELKERKDYECKTLDALIDLLVFLGERKIKHIFYARGPGSFTAIKLTHIFVQTLSITKEIELYSTDTFYFNSNSPIRAFGNQYFVKEDEEIMLRSLEKVENQEFVLPQKICKEDFSRINKPLYILPPV
ncbi:hypothetical protein [Helicobacter cholecystus]|uniref:hypothetical protein n=1 Tax=Helicobacter cholecystus TaxID=45498 RepID=UPI00273872F8|nr:hypothetical protein [Helicobacter cholecystus]